MTISEGRKIRICTIISNIFILLLMGLLTILPTYAIATITTRNHISLPTYLPTPLPAKFSADGKVVSHGRPLKAVVFDPTPSTTLRHVPPQMASMIQEDVTTSSFSITYLTDGSYDTWGERCYSFPSYAKTAFEAAANIWANKLYSSTPITIEACWAILDNSLILGYSGSIQFFRDFPAAPRPSTWYVQSLANALAGYDLAPSYYDMHITMNGLFNYYYGTDGNVPSYQVDFMSVALHEITHGLHYFGSMDYNGGYGYWGSNGYPDIYDVFMEDGSGNSLIDYSSGTYTLGNVLVSNNVWFHGSQAMAANGNKPVKIYTPSTWSSGSSYGHLDDATFNNTSNQLMVYSISNGESIHDPGTVTIGILKDLGWSIISSPFVTTQAVSNVDVITATGNGTITSLGIPNPTQYGFCWNTTGTPTIANPHTMQGAISATGAFSGSLTDLLPNTTYYVRAYATNIAGTVYGGQVNFTTKNIISSPSVLTQAVSGINIITATGNGNITSLGSSNPTQHGFCWNKTGNPTIANSRTQQGSVSATGAFSGPLTNLSPVTTYYVRAYATNIAGTTYGGQVSFTTRPVISPVYLLLKQ